jgi:proteic killer suppression protein
MKVTFRTNKLQELCEQSKLAQKELGQDCAKKMKRRLDEILDAESVYELKAGRPHPLKGDRAGQFAVDLHGKNRLVFEPDQNPVPRKADGSIDWSKVTQIRESQSNVGAIAAWIRQGRNYC